MANKTETLGQCGVDCSCCGYGDGTYPSDHERDCPQLRTGDGCLCGASDRRNIVSSIDMALDTTPTIGQSHKYVDAGDGRTIEVVVDGVGLPAIRVSCPMTVGIHGSAHLSKQQRDAVVAFIVQAPNLLARARDRIIELEAGLGESA